MRPPATDHHQPSRGAGPPRLSKPPATTDAKKEEAEAAGSSGLPTSTTLHADQASRRTDEHSTVTIPRSTIVRGALAGFNRCQYSGHFRRLAAVSLLLGPR